MREEAEEKEEVDEEGEGRDGKTYQGVNGAILGKQKSNAEGASANTTAA